MIINLEKSNERIDKALSQALPEYSRSQINRLIKSGKVLINGENIKSSFIVETDLEIEVLIEYQDSKNENTLPKAENLPLDIIYEDEDIILVNKAAGMVVHPGVSNKSGTLVNALMYYCDSLSTVNGIERSGIVHRLDKETSGIIVCAKNEASHINLQKQFKERTVEKIYLALVHGNMHDKLGKIDLPLGRNPLNRQKMAVLKEGKRAITYYKVLDTVENTTLLELNLLTGRTHQIRVHLNYINHPIVGDELYGYRRDRLASDGMFLHSRSIEFNHPRTAKRMKYVATIPNKFEKTLERLDYNLDKIKLDDSEWNLSEIDAYDV